MTHSRAGLRACGRSQAAVLKPAPLRLALAAQVTFVEALPNIMPGFDKEIARTAQRLLINNRPIDFHTNVIASKVTPGASWGVGAGAGWEGQGRR